MYGTRRDDFRSSVTGLTCISFYLYIYLECATVDQIFIYYHCKYMIMTNLETCTGKRGGSEEKGLFIKTFMRILQFDFTLEMAVDLSLNSGLSKYNFLHLHIHYMGLHHTCADK